MSSNVAPRGIPQGIYASLLAAVARGDTRDWFSNVVEDRVPDGVVVPANEYAFDHLLAIVNQHGDRSTVEALGGAAGDLLADLLRDHRPPPTPGFLRVLARLLLTLQYAPASPNVWRTLLFGYQSGDLAGISPEGLNIRHLALLALSTAPPENAFPLNTMLAFFQQELRDRPDFAPAAFAGLRRLAPSVAVQHVPEFIAALQAADPPIPPESPLWELFISLDEIEPASTSQGVSPAEELGQFLRDKPALAELINRKLDRELGAVEDFPRAWAAFQRGLASAPVSRPDEIVITPRGLNPQATQRARAAGYRRSGPLLTARPSSEAA